MEPRVEPRLPGGISPDPSESKSRGELLVHTVEPPTNRHAGTRLLSIVERVSASGGRQSYE